MIVPIYEAKKEGKLQDFVQSSSNPVDQGKSIQDVGNKVKKTPFKKRIQILKDRIEHENDEDIKKSQEKGI